MLQWKVSLAAKFLRLLFLGSMAILGGCNTSGDGASDPIREAFVGEFGDAKMVEFDLGGVTYRVFDKPAASKLLITKPPGAILVGGYGPTAKEPFEAAAMRHLANTGRNSCRLIETKAIIGPKHEIKYDCTPVGPPSAAKKGSRAD